MNEAISVLLIEDDLKLAEVISEFLSQHQIQVQHVATAQQALTFSQAVDMIISDIMLPDLNGLLLFNKLRLRCSCPIVFLSALTLEHEQITGLETGAADYLCKPIAPLLLLAKIRSALRFAKHQQLTDKRQIGDLLLDKSRYQAFFQGESLQLTALEFDIFWLLCSHQGQVVGRDLLFQEIVGRPYDGIDRAIDLKISRLRRKLADNFADNFAIAALRGQGYMFSYGSAHE
ncbi:response regulator transcription factor [Arsukibacterium sp.]|uniref:response regulator transcription factor n=1 Tax=Arsukibacterium sp. TaxID=1977258 RepID=UPI002FDB4498